MASTRHSSLGRIVVLVIVAGITIVVCGVAYVIIASPGQPAPASGSGDQNMSTRDARRLGVTLLLLLVSLLLILAFVIGSYLLIRVGRAVVQRPVGGAPTTYADAWSTYRLSDERVDEVIRGLDADALDAERPSGDDPQAGQDDPQTPDRHP